MNKEKKKIIKFGVHFSFPFWNIEFPRTSGCGRWE
jgi:hypothetical protein